MPILFPDLRRVPSGDYTVEVIFMDHKRSAKENPMVIAELEIVEGSHRGTVLKAFFIVTAEGIQGWPDFTRACGFDRDERMQLDIKTCIGSRLCVYVNDEGWIRDFMEE